MTIVHTPRVIASVVRGLRNRSQSHQQHVGLTPSNPHKYQSRVGVFDIDYLGHLNNAAFLSHAEYARWEMTAANGLLQAMYNSDTHFMVTSSSCRYRAQVRPLFKRFEVHSVVGGMDDKNLWIYQTFRYPNKGDDRVRAQILVKGVTARKGKVVDPREFLVQEAGFDPAIIESLSRPCDIASIEDMITQFEELEESYRHSARLDDEKRSD
mmetsp:Transcript_132079/g.196765  ORF Transcript_132079/g.196765 Transcript_132079/m.196765 type:complete len:210 (+) Transcript_132079:153-782(+)|eukprot:CAMPEP_0117021266 /NCGR_PEP_ID=MMETSP0472-20121206/16061_1 /TAXON_ID=693140 ORGANISM="Tiarina fusus, Strain LIS" /NCGR_SAMPLE_ID=MMETSP0472 /ASSEMBLY_ACC=CAM_ASM_000603 /LENGTH=209 /DNA_ID=CAMNT_0004726693 /DNA_START=146 /DNA_END=775 /DNA_ORIENTATION=-